MVTRKTMRALEADLVAALRRSRKAFAVFQAMPPSHRQRWVAYAAEPKGVEARARRIARCVKDLSGAKQPGVASGYSGTPLVQKLGVKEGHRVALLGAPATLPAGLAALPAGVKARTKLGADDSDVIVLFADARADLVRRFSEAARRLAPDGGLWVAWPKRASGVVTDLTEDVVREIALAAGLVDNKVCAIDQTWSGLRCVYRLADRPVRTAQRR